MERDEMRRVLQNAGRTKAERADHLVAEYAKRGQTWVLGGPYEWSKDEIDNAVIALAEGRML